MSVQGARIDALRMAFPFGRHSICSSVCAKSENDILLASYIPEDSAALFTIRPVQSSTNYHFPTEVPLINYRITADADECLSISVTRLFT